MSKNHYLTEKKNQSVREGDGLKLIQTGRGSSKGGCALHPRGGVLSYMGHIGMCRCEGYGFQAVYSSIGYINQSVWV